MKHSDTLDAPAVAGRRHPQEYGSGWTWSG